MEDSSSKRAIRQSVNTCPKRESLVDQLLKHYDEAETEAVGENPDCLFKKKNEKIELSNSGTTKRRASRKRYK
jgi:hypothetical protein